MCGIAGYLCLSEPQATPDLILRMTRALRHRGPDDEGLALLDRARGLSLSLRTSDSAPGIPETQRAEDRVSFSHDAAFGHRRFSIVDLTVCGHQPFWSPDRRLCAILNGEVYNYVELRAELESLGHAFRTRSDTEVLLEAYRRWGTDCFERFVGFWAVALYDADRRAILLSRDRIGKAPLYWIRARGMLLWASEIKALRAAVEGIPVRPQAISDFITFGLRDVHDETFFEGIRTFPRASFAWIGSDGSFAPHRYWSFPRDRVAARDLSPEAAAGELRSRLAESLRLRVRADVPVAFELSGGLDSSALVAIAAGDGRSVCAYTVSFPGTEVDEEPFARAVRDRYERRIDYRVLTPALGDFFDGAHDYVAQMDEPFHSPNMLTNQQVWREMAGNGIRVSINGAGGDELFCGYPGIYYHPFLSSLLERFRLRRLHREIVRFTESPDSFSAGRYLRHWSLALAHSLKRRNLWPAFLSGTSRRQVSGARQYLRSAPLPIRQAVGSTERILEDTMTDWLMNYWLRSGHQSFMGVPIEVRAPFLDHRVVEYAFSLPVEYFIRDGWLKWILRRSVEDLLPERIVWRPHKMGFPFPFASWLPASKDRFARLARDLDCPYLRVAGILSDYDRLAASDPILLWRLMSVSLWWKRCILGQSLES